MQALNFGKDELYTAGGLPRGNYRATAFGPWGLAPSTPIALSRSQDVNLQVISYLDMLIVVVLGLSLVLGLLFIGRPEILSNLLAWPHRMAFASSESPFPGNWRDAFRVWRLNWRSLTRSSAYFEVSKADYQELIVEHITVLPEEQEQAAQSIKNYEAENDEKDSDVQTAIALTCPVCGSVNIVKMGRGRRGRQRVHCNDCGSNRTLILNQNLSSQEGKNESPK